MKHDTNCELSNLPQQQGQIINLLHDKDFLNKVSDLENTHEFIQCFNDKGIKMYEKDAEKIFDKKRKASKNIFDLRDNFNKNLIDKEKIFLRTGRCLSSVMDNFIIFLINEF